MNESPRGAHYRFFCNSECEYFPCHATEDREGFNCLFCYCPLYALGSKCGGNYRYTETGCKDCSACLLPHRRESYDYILSRYGEIQALIRENDKGEPLGPGGGE